MAFTKRKVTYRRKKYYRKSKYSTKASVAVVKKLVRKAVKNSAERKIGVSNNAMNLTSAGPLLELASTINQGDGFGAREGRSIFIRGIHIRGVIAPDSATVNTNFSCVYRWMIVRGKKENGTNLLVTDVISATDGLNSTFCPFAHYAIGTRSKYEVLYDSGPRNLSSGWVAPAPDVPPITHPFHSINKYIKVNKKVLYWNDTNSIEDGGIYVLTFSDLAVGYPTATFKFRIYFNDQ